jgi:hypothetical protein
LTLREDKAIQPLFGRACSHYSQVTITIRNRPYWEPPNLVILDPVPKEVGALPLFSGLPPTEKVKLCALNEDTNALTLFTQSGAWSWGIVVHRSEAQRELPQLHGAAFSRWDRGLFFYSERIARERD